MYVAPLSRSSTELSAPWSPPASPVPRVKRPRTGTATGTLCESLSPCSTWGRDATHSNSSAFGRGFVDRSSSLPELRCGTSAASVSGSGRREYATIGARQAAARQQGYASPCMTPSGSIKSLLSPSRRCNSTQSVESPADVSRLGVWPALESVPAIVHDLDVRNRTVLPRHAWDGLANLAATLGACLYRGSSQPSGKHDSPGRGRAVHEGSTSEVAFQAHSPQGPQAPPLFPSLSSGARPPPLIESMEKVCNDGSPFRSAESWRPSSGVALAEHVNRGVFMSRSFGGLVEEHSLNELAASALRITDGRGVDERNRVDRAFQEHAPQVASLYSRVPIRDIKDCGDRSLDMNTATCMPSSTVRRVVNLDGVASISRACSLDSTCEEGVPAGFQTSARSFQSSQLHISQEREAPRRSAAPAPSEEPFTIESSIHTDDDIDACESACTSHIGVGDTIELRATVRYAGCELIGGLRGEVQDIDEVGDAYVAWAAREPEWLLKRDLCNAFVVAKAMEGYADVARQSSEQNRLLLAMQRGDYKRLRSAVTRARKTSGSLPLIAEAERCLQSLEVPKTLCLTHNKIRKRLRWSLVTPAAEDKRDSSALEPCTCAVNTSVGEKLTLVPNAVQKALAGVAPPGVPGDQWLFEGLASAALAVPEGCAMANVGNYVLSNARGNVSLSAVMAFLEHSGSAHSLGLALANLKGYAEQAYGINIVAIQINLHPDGRSSHKQHQDKIRGRGHGEMVAFQAGTVTFSLGSSRPMLLKTLRDTPSCCADCQAQRHLWINSGNSVFFNGLWNDTHTHGIPRMDVPCGPRISIAMFHG